ncbi:hypothetical protein F183_A07370 [Bryobacterales bacterium F-183]|nr:hypothetical protein F183_A07370 [Bryobacterales bacterium F-183]
MIVIVAMLALLATGCVSRTVMTVPSPDGSAKAWVHESCGIPDCEVTVYLKSGWVGFAKVLAERSDCHINFAHIAWSPDSSKLGVYSNLGWCRDIHEGYDLNKVRRFRSAKSRTWCADPSPKSTGWGLRIWRPTKATRCCGVATKGPGLAPFQKSTTEPSTYCTAYPLRTDTVAPG